MDTLSRKEQKKIRMAAEAEERKAEKFRKKRERRNLGYRGCRWESYGCTEKVKVPGPASQPLHDDNCPFKCESTTVDLAWRTIRKFELENPHFKPNIWATLASSAHSFKPVERWEDSEHVPCTRDIPRLFKASLVWQNGEPPAHLAFSQAFKEGVVSNTKIHPPGSSTWDIASQLIFARHLPQDVIHAVDLEPKSLFDGYPMGLPPPLATLYSERVGYYGMNATPKFAFVDMHVDRGMSTISINCDQARKVWLVWPPNPQNEGVFYSHFDVQEADDELFKFSRLASRLSGGQIVITESKDAFFIPAGWIHAVVTLRGGFLIGYSWSAQEDSETLLRCFSLETKFSRSVSDLEASLPFIISCLALPLKSTNKGAVAQGLESWIELMKIIQDAAVSREIYWGEDIVEAATELVKSVADDMKVPLPSVCPCMTSGRQGGKTIDMRKHILKHIIKDTIEPVGTKGPAKGRKNKK